jgi:hypothetical protein
MRQGLLSSLRRHAWNDRRFFAFYGICAIALTIAWYYERDTSEPDGMHLVTSDTVPVFATKKDSITPLSGTRLTILKSDTTVPVIACIDEADYSIYKIGLSDGKSGYVNGGDYRLLDKQYSDSAWCGAKPRNSRWQWGWANCVGPEFNKFALDSETGPGPELPVFKLNRQLVLVVPKKFLPNAGSLGHEPRTCTKLSDLFTHQYLYFFVRGDWSSGAKPNNVIPANVPEAGVRSEWLTVRIDRALPEPQRSVEELKSWEKLDRQRDEEFAAAAREIGGLRCASWCNGFNGFETVSLRYWQRDGFVEIHASYNTKRYGGLQVYWSTNVSDLSQWQSIEHEIWKLVAEWSVLDRR